jgi:E3 ubiquitin-protein ligase EDD1
MLLCGCPDDFDPTVINPKPTSPFTSPPLMSIYNNENIFSLDEQQQTSQLDRFTYFLLAKCNTIKQTNSTSTTSKTSTTNDLLDILLNTLIREMSNPTHRDIARYVTARFVRSIIRLFIILSLQSIPDKTSTTLKRLPTNSNLTSTLTGPQSILFQCKRIFQSLTIISIHALVHMADLLISPVRHGIAKPTAMFNLLSTHTDILQGLEEVFNIDSEYYRAYQRYPTNGDLNETDIELTEEDDNNSDTQSQHEINTSNLNERQISTRENIPANLSDNESEMELELLAESDSDNESNHSAPNTNTHRTSATAGSENMALFSDDDNSESDDADSVRSDSVLGEGDETSQPEPMIFDDARDALAAAATSSSTATTSGTTTTNDRLVLVPSASNNPPGSNTQTANSTSSHLNVPRLTTRTAITGL